MEAPVRNVHQRLVTGSYAGAGVIVRFARAQQYAVIIQGKNRLSLNYDEWHERNAAPLLLGTDGRDWIRRLTKPWFDGSKANESAIFLLEFAHFSLPCQRCLDEVYSQGVKPFMVQDGEALQIDCTHSGRSRTTVIPQFHWLRWYDFLSMTTEKEVAIVEALLQSSEYHITGTKYKRTQRDFEKTRKSQRQ